LLLLVVVVVALTKVTVYQAVLVAEGALKIQLLAALQLLVKVLLAVQGRQPLVVQTMVLGVVEVRALLVKRVALLQILVVMVELVWLTLLREHQYITLVAAAGHIMLPVALLLLVVLEVEGMALLEMAQALLLVLQTQVVEVVVEQRVQVAAVLALMAVLES
jgi:hypothetical protein